MNASFYVANNTAQRIVSESLTNPNAAWSLVAVGMGGLVMEDRDGYYFPDGSAIVFTQSYLPVEYVGGYEYYVAHGNIARHDADRAAQDFADDL